MLTRPSGRRWRAATVWFPLLAGILAGGLSLSGRALLPLRAGSPYSEATTSLLVDSNPSAMADAAVRSAPLERTPVFAYFEETAVMKQRIAALARLPESGFTILADTGAQTFPRDVPTYGLTPEAGATQVIVSASPLSPEIDIIADARTPSVAVRLATASEAALRQEVDLLRRQGQVPVSESFAFRSGSPVTEAVGVAGTSRSKLAIVNALAVCAVAWLLGATIVAFRRRLADPRQGLGAHAP